MTDALIELKSGRVERYAVEDLPYLRRKLAGFGYAYLNSKTGLYEQARRIEPISDEQKQLMERIQTRSASIAERRNKPREVPNERLPPHLRLHRIYGL